MTPEVRGLVAQTKIRDADAFLVPLIRKGWTKGPVWLLQQALTKGPFVRSRSAHALRAALPSPLLAWDRYRPDLVNRSVIEIDAVRLPNGGDLHLVNALAQQAHLMEAARRAARSTSGLWVQFRIESAPLDLLE